MTIRFASRSIDCFTLSCRLPTNSAISKLVICAFMFVMVSFFGTIQHEKTTRRHAGIDL